MKFDPTINAQNIARIIACSSFLPEHVQVELVGTMFTHGEGNDYDYVVFVPNANDDKAEFDDHGYKATDDPSGEEDQFATFRRDDVNIMLTEDPEFFKSFKMAAEVTKYVNGLLLSADPSDLRDGLLAGLNKEQRIRIHRIIMNGEKAE